MTFYILLNGPIKSGRKEIAKALTSRLPNCIREELNGPLKHLFAQGLGKVWSSLENHVPHVEFNGMSGLSALQAIRTKGRGTFGPDFLARWLHTRVLGIKPIPDYVVIHDALFMEDRGFFNRCGSGHKCLLVHVRNPIDQRNFAYIPSPDFSVWMVNGPVGAAEATAMEALKNA